MQWNLLCMDIIFNIKSGPSFTKKFVLNYKGAAGYSRIIDY